MMPRKLPSHSSCLSPYSHADLLDSGCGGSLWRGPLAARHFAQEPICCGGETAEPGRCALERNRSGWSSLPARLKSMMINKCEKHARESTNRHRGTAGSAGAAANQAVENRVESRLSAVSGGAPRLARRAVFEPSRPYIGASDVGQT